MQEDVVEILRLIRLMLNLLKEQSMQKPYFTVEEFSELVRRAPFTVRSWCWTGRIRAEKLNTKSGPHARWVIPFSEYERYLKFGLLPIQRLKQGPDWEGDAPGAAAFPVRPKDSPKSPSIRRAAQRDV